MMAGDGMGSLAAFCCTAAAGAGCLNTSSRTTPCAASGLCPRDKEKMITPAATKTTTNHKFLVIQTPLIGFKSLDYSTHNSQNLKHYNLGWRPFNTSWIRVLISS